MPEMQSDHILHICCSSYNLTLSLGMLQMWEVQSLCYCCLSLDVDTLTVYTMDKLLLSDSKKAFN